MLLTSDSLAAQSITVESVTNRIEALRTILVKQQSRDVSRDEAREIGASLIELYQVLSEEIPNDSEN